MAHDKVIPIGQKGACKIAASSAKSCFACVLALSNGSALSSRFSASLAINVSSKTSAASASNVSDVTDVLSVPGIANRLVWLALALLLYVQAIAVSAGAISDEKMQPIDGGHVLQAMLGTAVISVAAGDEAVAGADAPEAAPVMFSYFEFAPHCYTVGGVATGSFIDVTRALMREADIDHRFVSLPLGRLYNEIERGKLAHMWVTIPLKSLQGSGYMVQPSIYEPISLELYGMAGHKPPTLNLLNNTSLIVIVGYRYSDLLVALKNKNRAVQLLAATSHQTAFKMLLAGRAPYVLDYQLPMRQAIAALPDQAFTITSVGEWIPYLFVSKTVPNAKDLHRRLEAATRRIIARRRTVTSD